MLRYSSMSSLRVVLIAVVLAGATACGPGDDGIATGVRKRIASDQAVSSYPVNVAARNKVVTLTGTVASDEAKRRAVRLAREQDGVLDVIDRLHVSETAATTGR